MLLPICWQGPFKKCVLIFSLDSLTPATIRVIKDWLKLNVPDFADFIIAPAGKYLGWYLGRNAVTLSFSSPFSKYAARVQEVFDGAAPSATSIVKYNQQAVPVFSYHA